ncbi:MAG: polysaccharide deacetylase family protein [Euryarchaeota archaeon]|nr:polysaccharide deacetylase family protein [Euryarchaeota archaeon]
MRRLALTVDVEQDCPPVLQSMRGVEEGLPELLEMFAAEGVRATFFVDARIAELYPELVERIPEEGHELGCHGYSHVRLDRLPADEAREVIATATGILREFGRVTCFRAPNLKLPRSCLGVLEELGYRVDSSIASYKPPFPRGIERVGDMLRVPVSATSSVLRLPPRLVLCLLLLIRNPVLFVHPWEFVRLGSCWRPDMRFGTGRGALKRLRRLILHLSSRGYSFVSLSELACAAGVGARVVCGSSGTER